MKAKDLRNLGTEELIQKRDALKKQLFSLNKERISGRVEKPHLFSVCRKDIARIETVIKENNDKASKKKPEDLDLKESKKD